MAGFFKSNYDTKLAKWLNFITIATQMCTNLVPICYVYRYAQKPPSKPFSVRMNLWYNLNMTRSKGVFAWYRLTISVMPNTAQSNKSNAFIQYVMSKCIKCKCKCIKFNRQSFNITQKIHQPKKAKEQNKRKNQNAAPMIKQPIIIPCHQVIPKPWTNLITSQTQT